MPRNFSAASGKVMGKIAGQRGIDSQLKEDIFVFLVSLCLHLHESKGGQKSVRLGWQERGRMVMDIDWTKGESEKDEVYSTASSLTNGSKCSSCS